MEGSWDLEVTLYIVSRKGLSDKVTFEQRPKGSQGGSCAVPEEACSMQMAWQVQRS